LISGWDDDSGQTEKRLYRAPGKNGRGMGGRASNHTRQPIKKPVKWGIWAEKSRIQTFQLESCSWAAIVAVLIPYELDTSAFKKLQGIFEPSRCIICIWCCVH
jgi:hypothetical protein